MATVAQQQKDRTSLKQHIRNLEDNIITISGPALAISGIIAGIDVLTANIIRANFPVVGDVLGVVWAVCLMLTLDFQVLTLGVKSSRVYRDRSKGWAQKGGEMVLAIAMASIISYVSVQMGTVFARTLGTTMTIDQAEAMLGINPVALFYERSAMVMLLIFMSGWLRDVEIEVKQANPASSISTETMHLILAKLAKLDALEQHLTTIVTPVSEPAQIEAPKDVDPLLEPSLPLQDENEQMAVEEVEKPKQGLQYGDAIEALYKENPDITPGEIVKCLGCSRKTASEWLKRVKPVNE
jgi:hypothetical protein